MKVPFNVVETSTTTLRYVLQIINVPIKFQRIYNEYWNEIEQIQVMKR